MRRYLLWTALTLACFVPGYVHAQAPSPFELVRGLRDEGMPELALEYIEKIRASNPTPEIAALLSLETARTRLELASLEVEDSKRNAQLATARNEFNAFLAANPKHPQRPQANLEVARLIALQGKTQLSQARRTEGENRLNEVKKARPFFLDASKRFEAAAKELKTQADSLGESSEEQKLKREAENGILRAQLEQGVALFDLGMSFIGEGEVRDRGKSIDDAKKVLEKIANADPKNPLCWVAQAWVAQADYENDRKNDAKTAFDALLKERNPAAYDGIRLARYFRIRHTFDDPTPNRYGLAQKAAQTWLDTYPRYRNSPEGIATRYLLALAIQSQVAGNVKRDMKTGKLLTPLTGPTRQQLDAAAKIYKSIADTDNEYTERAVRNRMSIILDLSAGRVDDPSKLVTFEEAFLAAQVEQAELSAESRKEGADPKMLETERKKTYEKIVGLLNRALELVKPTDPARDVFDAQMLLAYAYLTTERYLEAAVLSEHIARTNPTIAKASNVAMMGLQAYNEAMQSLTKNEMQPDPEMTKADVSRIVGLAMFMDKTWPTESVTDTARHQLGFYMMREQRYPEAFQALVKISPNYSDVYAARTDAGAAVFFMTKNKELAEDVKTAAVNRAIKDLLALTAPAADADADDAVRYVKAMMQLGQLYLLSAENYPKAEELGKKIIEQLATFKNLAADQLKDNERLLSTVVDLRYQARALSASGLLGRANQANREKDFAKVAELVTPTIEDVQKDLATAPAPESIEAKAPSREFLLKMQRNILVLAMRTAVQENKIDKAKEILELLQKAGGSVESTIDTLRQVVREVRAKIDESKKTNPEEAKALSASFTALLDQISSPESLPDTPTDPAKQAEVQRMLIFLAQGYASIDQYTKAIGLLERVKKPEGYTPQTAAKKDDAYAAYRSVELLMAQTYRKAGAAETDPKLGAPYFKKADALLKSMIGDTKVKGWAFSSIEVRKETFYLLEDQKRWADAITGWSNYAKAWQKQIEPLPKDPQPGDPTLQKQLRVRNIFCELFVETQRCLTRANDTLKDESKKATQFEKIAKSLLDIEMRYPEMDDTVRDEIRKLLGDYPLLAEKYKAAGGKLLNDTTASTTP